MTYYDHAMLGASLALAAGAHSRHGWAIVAVAALAGMLPDWDALSKHVDPDAYRSVHRSWGHNLLTAPLAGGLLGAAGFLVTRSARARWRPALRDRQRPPHALAVWVSLGVLSALLHLAMDVLYCGCERSPDWPVGLLWPFTARGAALPLVPFTDRGATAILAAGLLLAGCWRPGTRLSACLTLLAVACYVALRGGGVV
jgi:membrane-bound metal-dependent hydrolase YbcI (DUF457 family)